MDNASIWQGTAAQTAFPVLEGRVTADVAIVGGGITGLTLAMLLTEAGKSVALVEAHAIGQGTSGNSTGNLYEVLSEQLYPVGEKWNRSVMGAVADARRAAMALVERTAARLGGDCGFARRALYFYATNSAMAERVDKEYEAAVRLGLPARLADEVPGMPPSVRALVLENQAQFHPLAYLQLLAQRIASEQCRIYERSAAIDIDTHARAVHTARGSVEARDIVLATHTPKGLFLVQAEMLPNREYGIGLRLASGSCPEGIFWGVGDYRHSVRSLHAGGTDYLIVVGEEHKTGHHDATAALRRLEDFARRHFDVASIDYRWSAQNYRSADLLPYIGRSHGSELYIATGFAADGLTWGTVAARILADEILGRENPWADLFRARRLPPLKSAKGVLEENLSVVRALVEQHVRRPHAALAAIAPGSGAVVEIDGEKIAAYRDVSGAVSGLSPVCPHMKCHVHWNAVEKSWDCPCHGSRFDLDGQVIEGPALSPLARKPLPEGR